MVGRTKGRRVGRSVGLSGGRGTTADRTRNTLPAPSGERIYMSGHTRADAAAASCIKLHLQLMLAPLWNDIYGEHDSKGALDDIHKHLSE